MPAEVRASGLLWCLPRCWREGGVVPTGNIFGAAGHCVTAAQPVAFRLRRTRGTRRDGAPHNV